MDACVWRVLRVIPLSSDACRLVEFATASTAWCNNLTKCNILTKSAHITLRQYDT